MKNLLLETIKETLNDVHIGDGTKKEFDSVCLKLEKVISEKILKEEIDYYTEYLKND